jgi:hypothetical protein
LEFLQAIEFFCVFTIRKIEVVVKYI